MKHEGLKIDLQNLMNADTINQDAMEQVINEAYAYIEHLEKIEDKFNGYCDLLNKFEDEEITKEVFIKEAIEVYEAK